MPFRQCKIYVRVPDGRCGIADYESQRKFNIRFGADGPCETHWKKKCEIITEAEFDAYVYA